MKFSMLLPVRKNSKFLAKFMMGYLSHTKDFNNIELLILASKQDTWNQDIFDYYKLNVFRYDMWMGHSGRNLYFNELAKHATGDWLWYICDDHYLLDGYDEYLVKYINENHIDSKKIGVIIPKTDRGYINHIISRGWYNAVGRISGHEAADSFINGVRDKMIKDRTYFPDQQILIDYTEKPVMTHEHSVETGIPDPNIKFPDFSSEEVQVEINKDAKILYDLILIGK